MSTIVDAVSTVPAIAYHIRARFARLHCHCSERIASRKHNHIPKLTEHLHTAAAAEYIGVAQKTLRKWAARGDILMYRNPRFFEEDSQGSKA